MRAQEHAKVVSFEEFICMKCFEAGNVVSARQSLREAAKKPETVKERGRVMLVEAALLL